MLKFFAVAILASILPVMAQVTNLGPININLAVTWDTPDLTNRTDLVGWNCWVYPKDTTNGAPLTSFFLSNTNYVTNNIGDIPGKVVYGPGSLVMTNLSNGPKVLAVSTLALGSLKGPTNYCTIEFNNGQLTLNKNYRLWEFITAVAQQPLPPLP
jgi:hypothetical protein